MHLNQKIKSRMFNFCQNKKSFLTFPKRMWDQEKLKIYNGLSNLQKQIKILFSELEILYTKYALYKALNRGPRYIDL